jgi:hypothetical protein
LGVAEADGIYVVLVSRDAQDGLSSLDVVNVDATVACAGYDLAAVTREADGPDAKICVKAARVVAAEVGEVEEVGLRVVFRVGRC